MKLKILILAFSLPVFGMSRFTRIATSLSTTALAGCAVQLVVNYVQQQQDKNFISLSDASEKTKAFVKERTGLDNIFVKCVIMPGQAFATHTRNSDFIIMSSNIEDEIIEGKNIGINTAIIQHEAGHIKDKGSQKIYRDNIISALIQTHLLSMVASTIIPTPKNIPLLIAKYALSVITKTGLILYSLSQPYLISNNHITIINPTFLIKQKSMRDGELRADTYIEPEYIPYMIEYFKNRRGAHFDIHHVLGDKEERKIVKLLQTHPSLKKRIRLLEERLVKSKENILS